MAPSACGSDAAQLGVVVVFEPEVPGSHVCGAVRWIDSDKALVIMSLRHRWADVFWFSFFHEIAHVLLHDRKRLTFVDGPPEDGEDDQSEIEANGFAARTLIPSEYDGTLNQLNSKQDIQRFADEIDIHPGIVLGRLQHDGILRSSANSMTLRSATPLLLRLEPTWSGEDGLSPSEMGSRSRSCGRRASSAHLRRRSGDHRSH